MTRLHRLFTEIQLQIDQIQYQNVNMLPFSDRGKSSVP